MLQDLSTNAPKSMFGRKGQNKSNCPLRLAQRSAKPNMNRASNA